MIEKMITWANNSRNNLDTLGIKTIKIFSNNFGAYIDHETKNCIGRISCNNEGHFDIEIIEIESEVKLMLAHYAFQKEFFEDMIDSYIRILKESINKVQSKYHNVPINEIK